jgi:hypothetical protein
MLTDQNIEAELSYAYLHAVAARGGFACTYSDRHLDGAGVDAIIYEDGRRLSANSRLTSFEVHIQLKATFKVPVEQEGKFSYSLTVPRYDRLRTPKVNSARFLVVLYLPSEATEWLNHSEDGLITKRCAYWVSLRNAPDSANPKHQTIYIPRSQMLTVDSLTSIMAAASRQEEINYDG